MAVKEKYVADVDTLNDVDDSICFIWFLVFSFPWSFPIRERIFVFRLNLVIAF